MSDNEFDLSSEDESAMLEVNSPALANPMKRKLESTEQTIRSKKSRIGGFGDDAMKVATKILKEKFGLPGFRLKQAEAIQRLLDGDSAVVVFPTGGGKSLCYQVPAVAFKEFDRITHARAPTDGGISIVVSPLIALMKDQVDALRSRGLSAAVMDSTKTREEFMATQDAMRNGTLDILYCAPERLNNEGFMASMAQVRGGVRLLAVDEAHCISQWGHSFRPDYLKVARFAKEIQAERVICLTATATPAVADDICKAFDIPEAGLFRTTTYRPNLRLHAESFQEKTMAYQRLLVFLKEHPGSTIIYVTLQKHTEALASKLTAAGYPARPFHAGMRAEQKIECQEAFMKSNALIVVATIAFGMDIDKANIRNVIHYDVPRSLEGYSQEIGRAGRDGLQSHCVLYLCAEDLHLGESFARGDLPSKQSVEGLLEEFFSLKQISGMVEVSAFQQSRSFDMRPTVIANIFAQLELRFGLLRATTPKYTSYQYKKLRAEHWDTSPAANAIRTGAVKKKIWAEVDVDKIARTNHIPREELISKLNHWHETGIIELKAGGVMNMYRVMKPFPSTPKDRTAIVNSLYAELQIREQQDLERLDQVFELVNGQQCLSKALANHFGDELPNPECGHCVWCETYIPVPRVKPQPALWDPELFREICDVCCERDDPRYLARIAFGISSPRVTQAKLGSHRVFGSMERHSFSTLVAAFQKVCDEEGCA